MTKRHFSPITLKDIDSTEHHLHKLLDTMEESGQSDAVELIWGVIENERLMHLKTLKTALKAQNVTQRDSSYYQALMVHYHHKNKKRFKSSSIIGKDNEHRQKQLSLKILQLTLEQYPQATAKSLATKVVLYLGELGFNILPKESTISKNWVPEIRVDTEIKRDEHLQYSLVIPKN